MFINPPEIWFGSDLSLVNYLQRHEHSPPAQLYAGGKDDDDDEDEDEDDDPFEIMAAKLIERYESVGVVNVTGSLVSTESRFNWWFGDLAYPTIQRAINQLLADESISDIVMNYDTPGGDVNGVEELGELIKTASRIKPIVSWAANALSAGYWLAASADKVYTSRMGQTGSIAAITTVMSHYERLREAGIDPFVARSAPKKAIPHPAEPLTEVGKKVVQDRVNAYGEFFLENVARNRPALSYANAKSTWATGEVFFGDAALRLGLVDELKLSISALITERIAAHNQSLTSGVPTMAKKLVLTNLSDLGAARIAMGLDPETAAPIDPAPAVTAQEPDPTPDPAPAPDPDPAPIAAQDGFSTYLKEEIAELKAENSKLKADLQAQAQLKADLNTHQAMVAHLRPVAEAAVSRLAIGLRHRPMALDALPADVLAKTFTELQTELMGLPAGRKSAEPAVDAIEGGLPNTLMQQRLRLVSQAG